MSAHDLIVMMGLVLAASIGTQLLVERLGLPAILPLLGSTWWRPRPVPRRT